MEINLSLEEIRDKIGENPKQNEYSKCIEDAYEATAFLRNAVIYNPDGVADILGITLTRNTDGSLRGFKAPSGFGSIRDEKLSGPINRFQRDRISSCEQR